MAYDTTTDKTGSDLDAILEKVDGIEAVEFSDGEVKSKLSLTQVRKLKK